jgi:hypothetical protein
MANSLGQRSDVVDGADAMMREIIEEAAGLPLDKRLAVMQAATRWVAVKNRLNMPDERNGFDEFREQLSGGAAPAGSGEREDSAGPPEASLIKRPQRRRPIGAAPHDRPGVSSTSTRPGHA